MTPMPRILSLGLLCSSLLLAGTAMAVEAFVPPQSYPASRYEPGWEKNPFTLKTAPVVVQKESFVKDWTLGAIGGRAASPTVTVVNRQTHERVSLHGDIADKNGMKVLAVHNEPVSKNISVEVEMAGNVGTLTYDDAFLKTLSASPGNSKNPLVNPGAPGAPGTIPGAVNPRPPVGINPGVAPSPSIAAPPLPRPGMQNSTNPGMNPNPGGLNRRRYQTGPMPH